MRATQRWYYQAHVSKLCGVRVVDVMVSLCGDEEVDVSKRLVEKTRPKTSNRFHNLPGTDVRGFANISVLEYSSHHHQQAKREQSL